jgi:outer membrane protein assembly factor BamE (lipoprotein component of BamABCDE complex)
VRKIRYDSPMKMNGRHMNCIARVLATTLLVGLTACSPYRIEIQQGNYVSRDAMSQVKPGMNKEQVRAILGTPLINDIFHVDRWDYVFTRSAVNSRDVEKRKATLHFKDDILKSIEADVLPTERAKVVPERSSEKQ